MRQEKEGYRHGKKKERGIETQRQRLSERHQETDLVTNPILVCLSVFVSVFPVPYSLG